MDDLFTIEKNVVYKNGLEFLSFPSNIENILVLEDSIVVLISYTESVGEQNVFCYNFSKQFQWKIPQPIEIHNQNFYASIYLRENELCAYSISGVEYQLSKKTGLILKSDLIK